MDWDDFRLLLVVAYVSGDLDYRRASANTSIAQQLRDLI